MAPVSTSYDSWQRWVTATRGHLSQDRTPEQKPRRRQGLTWGSSPGKSFLVKKIIRWGPHWYSWGMTRGQEQVVGACRQKKRPESRAHIMKPSEATLRSSPLCNNEWIVKLFKQWNDTVIHTFLEGLFCQLKKKKRQICMGHFSS